MKTLRIIGAAFLVLLGSMLLVAWSVAGRTVSAIESGEAATNITQKLLDDPAFADAAAARVTEGLVKRTEGRAIQRIIVAFEPEIQQVVARVLASDRVNEAVTNSVSKVEEQLVDELTDPNRPTGPFVLTIDLSDRVNQRIDQIPLVGSFIPDVTVPPIERELIEADAFDDVRTIYGAIKTVATWGLIVGILMIVAGFWVAPRSRWYWVQAALATAFIVFAVSFAVRFLAPKALANAVPGGESGGGGTFLTNFVTESTLGPVAARLLGMAIIAFLLAVLFGVLARFLPKKPDAVAEEADELDLPDEPVLVPAGIVVSDAVADAAATDTPVAVSRVVDTVPLDTAPFAAAEVMPPAEVAATETVVVESPPSTPVTDAVAAEAVADEADESLALGEGEPSAADVVTEIDTPAELALPDEPALADDADLVAPPVTAPAKAATPKATATKAPTKKPAAKKPAAKKPAAKKPATKQTPAAEAPAPRSSSRARKPAPPKE